ncbi:MAG: radical SAM protein [Nanoarchaeota archaeon]|nr:radical SAM protein [Nanoarchaeota archaeon]
MAKLLFIQPSFSANPEKREFETAVPLALVYIATVAENNGHSVKIIDRNMDFNDKSLIISIKNFSPDLVGITAMTGYMINDALHVAKIVRENSNAEIIWGGVHPSLRPANTLSHPLVDYVVRGEGELVFSEIADYKDKGKDFSGLYNVNLNPMREFVELDKLPLPNYDLVDVKKYDAVGVQTSRGCPFRCSFCYNDGFWGKEGMKRWRGYSTNKTIELIQMVAERYKRKQIPFYDDNFPNNRKRAIEICNGISNLDLKIYIFSRVNYCQEEMMQAYKKAGVWIMQFGLETGSQRLLDFLRKDVTVQMMSDAIKQCKKHRMLVDGSFMIGLPTETKADLQQTVKFINENKIDFPGLKIYHPYPSTMAYDYCIEKKLITEPINLEEWASRGALERANLNVSEIPTETLMKIKQDIERKAMIKGWVKKGCIMLREGRMPPFVKVRQAVWRWVKGF